MSRAKRVDANQAELVELGRELGAKIAITSAVGDGFPDSVWQYRHLYKIGCVTHGLETYLVEIKDGSKPPSKRKLTPDQVEFHSVFNCHIIECRADVFDLLGQNDWELK